MPKLGQAQVGTLKGIPRRVDLKAQIKDTLVLKNYGNNHNVPFSFTSNITVVSGEATAVIADSLTFQGMDLATYGNFVATATTDPGDRYWVEHDTVANTVTLTVGTAVSDDVVFKVFCTLGESVDLSDYHVRGFGAPAQSLP